MEGFLGLTRQHLTGLFPEQGSGAPGPTGLREGRTVRGTWGGESEDLTETQQN